MRPRISSKSGKTASDVARVERSETRGLAIADQEPRVSLRSTRATYSANPSTLALTPSSCSAPAWPTASPNWPKPPTRSWQPSPSDQGNARQTDPPAKKRNRVRGPHAGLASSTQRFDRSSWHAGRSPLCPIGKTRLTGFPGHIHNPR